MFYLLLTERVVEQTVESPVIWGAVMLMCNVSRRSETLWDFLLSSPDQPGCAIGLQHIIYTYLQHGNSIITYFNSLTFYSSSATWLPREKKYRNHLAVNKLKVMTCMRQWTWSSSLVSVACRLSGAETLPEPIKTCMSPVKLLGTNFNEVSPEIQRFSFSKMHLNESSAKLYSGIGDCRCVYSLIWGRVTHIYVDNLTIIGSDNGLSPGRRQAIIWTYDGILSIGPLGTNFSEILIGTQTFSFKKIGFKCRLRNGVHFVSASMCWIGWDLGRHVLDDNSSTLEKTLTLEEKTHQIQYWKKTNINLSY